MKKVLLAGVAALALAGPAHADEQAELDAKIRTWCDIFAQAMAPVQVDAQTEKVVPGAKASFITGFVAACIGGVQLRLAVDPAAAAVFRNISGEQLDQLRNIPAEQFRNAVRTTLGEILVPR
jgi:outer membrane lipoprotein SlyB